jgi:hyperosmotically inducible protein
MSMVRVLALAVLFAAPGASATAADDRRLTLASTSAVRLHEQFTIFDEVSAAARDGVVVLTGKVTTAVKKDSFEKRVAQIPGVERVDNRVTVLPSSPSDEDLRHRVARNVYGHANFWSDAVMPDPPVHIIVEQGHVTLIGVVRSAADRALARALAMQANPVAVAIELQVHPNLEVRRE